MPLRRTWSTLTFTVERPPKHENPVAPAHRSDKATAKARTKTDPDHQPVRSFRGLLDHLATLTRNTTPFADWPPPNLPTTKPPRVFLERKFSKLPPNRGRLLRSTRNKAAK